RTQRGGRRSAVERRTRHVLRAVLRHREIVFDANAAEFSERIDLRPVHEAAVLTCGELLEQRFDEVETRLDREDIARLDAARQPQIRMSLGFLDRPAALVGHEAADIVNLQAEVMTETVREEERADALLDDCGGIEIHEVEPREN